MLKDTQPPRYAVRRTHRTYTPQFKAELVAACQQPGASIAALALQHGMNTNVLHRWLKEHRQGHHRLVDACGPALPGLPPSSTPAFFPIDLQSVLPATCSMATTTQVPPAAVATTADIRLECQRQGVSMTVHWPVSAAAECAQLLREWLR